MQARRRLLLVVAATLCVLTAGRYAGADPAIELDAALLDFHTEEAALPDSCNYDWWYGCSPTSAGMLVGSYHRNGYNDLRYDNLVPGGVAEANTFGNPDALVNAAIASPGHITDFYGGGYGASGDDLAQPWHELNCLADFMGTSQDAAGNVNGGTTFYYWNNGAPFAESDAEAVLTNLDKSGMHGIGEYLEYAGYDAAALYNQYIDAKGLAYGFTYDQYKAEIDACRPVLIHVEGHTMFGYGYIDGTDTIQVYDTWNPDGQNPGIMAWGGAYPYGSQWLDHYGVTVLEVTGGSIHSPEPLSMAFWTVAGLGLVARRCRRRRREAA